MPLDRFMIAPLDGGLQNDVKPWLTPDQAFVEMNNAYVFRGRVRKRFGTRYLSTTSSPQSLFSRLRISVGTTDGTGALSGTVPGSVFAVGQMFSIGSELYTVALTGNQIMLDTGTTTTKTFNTANGNFVFAGAPINTPVFFYSAQPVMGLVNYEILPINDEKIIAFDTQFAYQRTGGAWARITAGSSVWQGSNSEFFWAENFTAATALSGSSLTYLFVTNYDSTDPNFMRYFDGTTWFNFNPSFSSVAGNTVVTARLIISFKGRLLLLNTVENNSVLGNGLIFKNRMRFSTVNNALGATAWYEQANQAGFGGVLDNNGTQEAIVSAEFIKDRLIVFFERSTWEIAYTGNNVLPFIWQKINTELGVQSTFSVIPFDKVILGFGETGIEACNGANVERIDDKIPNEIFSVNQISQGVERVFGIRDYYTELAYWTFPDNTGDLIFPNRVLVYNYKTQSWAFNDDTITCFGYYYNETSGGATWEESFQEWEEATQQWNSSIFNQGFRSIIAGNQQGYTFIVDADLTENASVIQVTNLANTANGIRVTAVNHNLSSGQFIVITGAQGVTGINGIAFQVGPPRTANTFIIPGESFTGTYTGGGTFATISRIDLLTKQYNFYLNTGRNLSVSRVDFFVDNESDGQVSVDYMASSAPLILGTQILETSPYALYPLEFDQDRLWHPIYPFLEGEFIQLRIYLSDTQLQNLDIAFSDFQLHALTFYAQRTSDRLQ